MWQTKDNERATSIQQNYRFLGNGGPSKLRIMLLTRYILFLGWIRIFKRTTTYFKTGRIICRYSLGLHSPTKNSTGSKTAAKTSWLRISCSNKGQVCWNQSFCKKVVKLCRGLLDRKRKEIFWRKRKLPVEWMGRLESVLSGKIVPFGLGLSFQSHPKTEEPGRQGHWK